MRPHIRALLFVVACFGTVGIASAQEQPAGADKTSSERLQAIEQKFRQTVSAAQDRAAQLEAVKQRQADWRALLSDVEKIDPAKMTYDDHATAATLYQQLGLPEEAIPHAEAAVKAEPDNEASHALLVRTLLANKQLDAAETAFAAAMEKFPQSEPMKAMRIPLFASQMSGGSAAKGADHLGAYIDDARGKLLDREDVQAPLYLMRIDQLATALDRAERKDDTVARLDRELAAVRELTAKGNARLNWVASELLARKIVKLAESGKKDEAKELFADELTAAQDALKAEPDNVNIALRVIPLVAIPVLLADGEGELEKAQEPYFAFLAEQAKKHAGSAEMLTACVQSPAKVISQFLASDRSAEAASMWQAATKFIEGIEPDGNAAEQALLIAKSNLAGVARQIESEQAHATLIGKDAFAIQPESWVNGTPLTNDELKGKVVLLDFWAVWCGPCIATFPHLREWNEKYADKGLVIVGVTNYYKYGWNAEEERPEPTEGITPEQERVALEQFAKHYELKHRFAVMPEMSDFAEKYGVTGIPQVVVIDKQGKIRLIKVGSGPDNAHAVEAMLERLLGDAKSPCDK